MKNLIYKFWTIGIIIVITSCSTTEEQESLPGAAEPKISGENASAALRRSEKLHIIKGPQVPYGEGKLRSFVSLDDENFPVEIGVIMTAEVLEDLTLLPPDEITTVLPLHQKAKEATAFEHLGIKWSEPGHAPVFFNPHFDFYFFMISNEARLAIPEYTAETQDAFTLLPPEGYMPEQYGTPPGQGGVYPYIGKHWLPLNLPSHLPFTKIMVMGSYNGEFIFVEPMATLDYLLSGPDFSAAYPQPEFFQEATNYPTEYNIYVDPDTGDIYVSLSEFIARW